MAFLAALVAGWLVVAESQASNKADPSNPHGFLSKYLPFESDASKTSFYDKFIPNLNHMEHGNGPEASSQHKSFAETVDIQYTDVHGGYGGKAVSNIGDRSFTTLHDKPVYPIAQAQNSIGFRTVKEELLMNTKDFDLLKTAKKEEDQPVQKLLANGSNTPITLSAIGVGLLTLVIMLGVRIRRKLQPATVLASNGALGSDMSINIAAGLGDNIMEMESQGSSAKDAAAHGTRHLYTETSGKVGWGQLSSKNSQPLTFCSATPPSEQVDPFSGVEKFEDPTAFCSHASGARSLDHSRTDRLSTECCVVDASDAMRASTAASLCCAFTGNAFKPPLQHLTLPALRAAIAEPQSKSTKTASCSTKEGPPSTLIAGGGPAGLLTAIAFAKRGWTNIRVVDRLRELYDPGDEGDELIWSDAVCFYLEGLGLRGQTALGELGPRDTIERYFAEVVGRKLGDLGARYQQLVKDHYVPMACLQAAVLAGGADVMTQTLEYAQALDWSHVGAMSTVASTMSGGANAVWLRQLEDMFPGRETDAIMKKTMIHAVILASIINSAYLAGVPALTDIYSTGFPVTEGVEGWTLPEFAILTKLEVCMFIPYNTLAFSFVPPRVRPLTHAMVSATFNVAVSAVTLGYFDAWVDRVAHLAQ